MQKLLNLQLFLNSKILINNRESDTNILVFEISLLIYK